MHRRNPSVKLQRVPRDHRFAFLREFLRRPLQVASLIPSSRFLERRIVEAADVASAQTIVELGPGTGGTTRAILSAMRPDATLLSIELNARLHALVRGIPDGRLIAHLGSACELPEILTLYGLDAPQAIISGIPFSVISRTTGDQFLQAVAAVLAPGGRFVTYQVSNRVAAACRPLLGAGRMDVELRNVPPLRVYRWEKSCV